MIDSGRPPWHKNPIIIVPAIVVIVVGIVTGVLVPILLRDGPPAGFTLSISPMQGTVLRSGVLQATVAVKGEHGYEHSVNLSASGQPADVVVTFNPPFENATPTYTSTMTVSIGDNVTVGDYELLIKGTGSDGQEHTCKYMFTVRDEPITTSSSTTTTSTAATTSSTSVTTIGGNSYMVFSDTGIAGGDVLVWSGADWDLEPPFLDGSYSAPDSPEGTACFKAIGGAGPKNYVGWGVFLGTFEKDHTLVTPATTDLTSFGQLVFMVKTGTDLKVEVQEKGHAGRKSSACLISDFGWDSGMPDVWQKVSIPQAAFGDLDWTQIFGPFMITGKGDAITFYVDDVKWAP